MTITEYVSRCLITVTMNPLGSNKEKKVIEKERKASILAIDFRKGRD